VRSECSGGQRQIRVVPTDQRGIPPYAGTKVNQPIKDICHISANEAARAIAFVIASTVKNLKESQGKEMTI